jgi:hypothetical protein
MTFTVAFFAIFPCAAIPELKAEDTNKDTEPTAETPLDEDIIQDTTDNDVSPEKPPDPTDETKEPPADEQVEPEEDEPDSNQTDNTTEEGIDSPQFAQPGEITIFQLVSNPLAGEQESITIQSTVDYITLLTGFTVHDEVGVIFSFTTETTLPPHGKLTISGWGNKLNNSGDSVFIENPNDEIVAEVIEFGVLEKGEVLYPENNDAEPNPPSEEPEDEPIGEDDPPETDDEDMQLQPIAPGELVLSEAVANPVAGEEEWIEIQSIAVEERTLKDVTVFDAVGEIFRFADNATILPNQFVVISGWGSKLNNSGDTVRIMANDVALVAANELPATKKGDSWLFVEQTIGIPTPGAVNVIKPGEEVVEDFLYEGSEPLPQKGEIIVSEVYSNPIEGEVEWIEILSNSDKNLHLGGLRLYDNTGEFFTIAQGTLIAPNQYLQILGWKTKLNNSGDSVKVVLPDERIIAKVNDFPKLDKGIAYAVFDDGYKKTATATPGKPNMFTDPKPQEKEERKSVPPVQTKALNTSVKAEEVEMVISEVHFKGQPDFIELECKKCDTDLIGIRIADDDVVYEFGKDSFVASGERVVLRFDSPDTKPYFKDGTHYFDTAKKGLTSTDETVFLLDSRDKVIDAVCIANRNDSFSPGERDDLVFLIRSKKITGVHPFSENICADSNLLDENTSLSATGKNTGLMEYDYFAAPVTLAAPNPAPPIHIENTELTINKVYQITETHFLIVIINEGKSVPMSGFRVVVDDEEYAPNETMLESQAASGVLVKSVGIKQITLVDAWNRTGTSVKDPQYEEFTSGDLDLVVNEILANPKGTDNGNEFFELTCTKENCPKQQFMVAVNDEISPLVNDIEDGEFTAVYDMPLRNSDLTITVFDIINGVQQSLRLKKAEDGIAFARNVTGEYEPTPYPTPNAKNIIASSDPAADSDFDGIPDSVEVVLGLDPQVSNKNDVVAQNFYKTYLRRNTEVAIHEVERSLQIQGKTIPFAEIKLVLHSTKQVVSGMADDAGNFSIEAIPRIENGTHNADAVIIPPGGNAQVFLQITDFTISENYRDLWLDSIEIIAVLPNPSGNDKNRELVIIKNTGTRDGIAKGMQLKTEKETVELPEMTFKVGQRKVLSSEMIPALRNTTELLQLLDSEGKVLSTIDWQKAKSGAWYGGEAPAIPEKTKKGSSRKRKYRPPYIPPSLEEAELRIINGVFVGFADAGIQIETKAGTETFFLSEDFDEQTLRRFLAIGQEVEAYVDDNTLIHIRVPVAPLSTPEQSPFNAMWLILSLVAISGGTAGITQLLAQRGEYEFLFRKA